MPKQIYKIEAFHGGLNSSSDPRDIADNELAACTDFVVHELGKLRPLGGIANANLGEDVPNSTTQPGFGLFYFGHDRLGAHVRPGDHNGEHTAADHATVLTDTNSYWPVDGLIGATVNNITDGSSGVITDNSANTVTVAALTGGSDNSWDNTNDDDYTITDFPETGDDYLVYWDAYSSSDVNARIYSRVNEKWTNTYVNIDMGATEGCEPTHYVVDGSLRVSDGNFGAENTNRWYGYIHRTLFPNITPSVEISQWYEKEQECSSPAACTWNDHATFASPITSDTHTDAGSGTTDNEVQSTRASLASASMSNVCKVVVNWQFITSSLTPALVSLNLRCGTYNNDASTFTTYEDDNTMSGMYAAGTHTGTSTFTFAIANTATGSDWGSGDSGDDYFRSEFTIHTGDDNHGILSQTLYEEGTLPDPSANLRANNVHLHFDWEATTGASGWSNSSNTGEWKVGASFIYDETQESQIKTFVDDADDVTETFVTPGSHGATAAPSIRVFISRDEYESHSWNKRITGVNIYMQDVSQDTTQPWMLQLSGNFVTGKMKVDSTQKEFDINYHPHTSEKYYYWQIGDGNIGTVGSQMLEPSLITSYEMNSGLKEEEESIISKYKSAVVVGRRVYIGGLEVKYKDTARGTEVKGDAMIKSPVNKFDMFPLSRLIEASVQDGDSITHMEEYADRILQFKKNKMHLINVSQEVEFIEDTFMYKGITHPAAACKTDFGVAWVNKHGCYLYNGQNVSNLLEKGGRQIIDETTWASFINDRESDGGGSMIGYIPKKRQLLVVKDSDNITDSGDMYLYDMVTQSWVMGIDQFTGAAERTKSNFIVDWNGDLCYMSSLNDGTLYKWDDSADLSDTMSIKTKDIHFGDPARRKKIYNVRISYKGDGSAVTVQYAINGDTDTVGNFYRLEAGGDSDRSNDDTTPLQNVGTDDWVVGELVPVNPISNAYSFQLIFDGTSAADFEINDISIVYRAKNVK